MCYKFTTFWFVTSRSGAIRSHQTGSEALIYSYSDAISNASTLLYGVCNDHPFHNGNKRTALVAMLVHLDRNKLTVDRANQNDLYELDAECRRSSPSQGQQGRARSGCGSCRGYQWLQRSVRPNKVGERQINFRQLKRLLERYRYALHDPVKNSISLSKWTTRTVGLFKKTTLTELQNVWSIGYPGERHEVGVGLIKKVRERCGLTADDGVDSQTFYDEEAVVDGFVVRYSKALRRLARK